jgi:hypothetical protein
MAIFRVMKLRPQLRFYINAAKASPTSTLASHVIVASSPTSYRPARASKMVELKAQFMCLCVRLIITVSYIVHVSQSNKYHPVGTPCHPVLPKFINGISDSTRFDLERNKDSAS